MKGKGWEMELSLELHPNYNLSSRLSIAPSSTDLGSHYGLYVLAYKYEIVIQSKSIYYRVHILLYTTNTYTVYDKIIYTCISLVYTPVLLQDYP